MTIEAYPEAVCATSVYGSLAVFRKNRIFAVVFSSGEKGRSSSIFDISHLALISQAVPN